MSKADRDGWVRHRGGECPVDGGAFIDVRYRGGHIDSNINMEQFRWNHDGGSVDIMAYRLHKQAEQVEACSKPELRSLPENYGEIIGGSVEGPHQWRDRITEIDATTQALTAERAELVQKLASEGFALIGRINDLLTDAAQKHEDMSDWRNWKAGDLVEIECENHGHCFRRGDTVKIGSIVDDNSDEDCRFRCYALDGSDFWFVGESECKFHSRPSA